MIEFQVAFRGEQDGRFTVLTQENENVRTQPVKTSFADENLFLEHLIAADLAEETTTKLAVAAILSIAQPEKAEQWIPVLVTEEQTAAMGLIPSLYHAVPDPAPHLLPAGEGVRWPASMQDHAAHFYDFLMNSPTPFAMLSGPTLVCTFVNPPYAQLLGRSSGDELLGRPVRDTLPDPGFQQCLAALEKAYATGIPQVRKELLNTFRQEDTGLVVEAYFDIVYHPVHDLAGNVTGIMAQATDVTERVLVRQVVESREQKLFEFWTELENIYAIAPDLQGRNSVVGQLPLAELLQGQSLTN